jgi:hypothetical protein
MSKQQLSKEELTNLQELNNSFTQAKISLGDTELQKATILSGIQKIKSDFAKLENELIKKYGEDSVINLQTGEVAEKKE